MKKDDQTGLRIQSVERALAILDLLCTSTTPLSALEISNILGIQRTTVHGLINTLTSCEYIEKDRLTGKYFVTVKMYAYSCAYPAKLPVVRLAERMMIDLANRYKIAVYLGISSYADEALIIRIRYPALSEEISSAYVLPYHASGLGKTLLAYMPEDKLDVTLGRLNLYAYTQNTITDKVHLIAELEEIRRRGYGRDNGEYMENTYCVAFPIFDANNSIVAAFSLSGTQQQIEEQEATFIPEALQGAKSRSFELGWTPKSNQMFKP